MEKKEKSTFKENMEVLRKQWIDTGMRYYVKLIQFELSKKGIVKTDNRIRNSINYFVVDYDILNSFKDIIESFNKKS